MNFYSILYLSGFIIFAGCSSHTSNNEDRNPIARVYDYYLYQDEIENIVPKGTATKDSIAIINSYIENWSREMVVLKKAENNLTETQKNVEKQLQNYRNSLITYTYEKELISQKLDTAVTNEEVELYYNNNKKDFELKDNILKVSYVKVNKKAPKIDKVKMWYKSSNVKDIESLSEYCHQFAENFYLDDESWLLFDDLLKEIPIQAYNKELFLQNNRYVEVEDSIFKYFVNIRDFKIKNTLSPLSFERDNIKNIIVNKRKIELIKNMKQDIYNEALNNKEIELLLENENIKK